jgi:type IV pilus assembly protein PilN
MRLDINLATHPYEDQRRFWLRWGSGLAFLGLITLILLYAVISGWITARKTRALIDQAQLQIAERDQEKVKAEATLNRPENRSTRDESQFLNDLFQRKAFSWTRVFEDLEKVMPARLHLVSIRPEMDDNNQLQLKMVVGGDSRDKAIELVHKMETSARFRQTYIQSENAQQSQSNGDSVRFEIVSQYVPQAPGESKPEEKPVTTAANKRGGE